MLESHGVLFSEFFVNLQRETFSTSKLFIPLSLLFLTELSQCLPVSLGIFNYALFACLLSSSKVTTSLIFKRVSRGKAFPAANIEKEERQKNVHSWNVEAHGGACAVPTLLLTEVTDCYC